MKPIIEYQQDYEQYLEHELGLAEATQKNYYFTLRTFLDWLRENEPKLKPNQLKREHITRYSYYLRKIKKDKKRRQAERLKAVRSLLDFFFARDILSIRKQSVILPRDAQTRRIHFLTRKEVEKLAQAPDKYFLDHSILFRVLRDKAIIETLFSTGARVSELRSLNRTHLPLHKLPQPPFEMTIRGKGGRDRPIFLSERALKALRDYLLIREDKSPALFVNTQGNRLTTQAIENTVKKCAKIAGLPDNTTPHTLRHSFATDLHMRGVDIRYIQEFLGHEHIITTQIYTHIVNPYLREIYNKHHSLGKKKRAKLKV